MMRVQFHKTSSRSYAIVVIRSGAENLRMDSAPGYDELMPHDLQHFIVEQALGIQLGIFGQLAVGGTANTFHRQAVPPDRQQKRTNRRLKKQGEVLLRAGYEQSMRSERATYISLFNWLSASNDPILRKRAAEMAETAQSIFLQLSEQEKKSYTPAVIAVINERMDELSHQWRTAKVGEYIELVWPS